MSLRLALPVWALNHLRLLVFTLTLFPEQDWRLISATIFIHFSSKLLPTLLSPIDSRCLKI